MKDHGILNLATLYSGRACHNIDGSNRIMLPSEWRIEGTPTRFFVALSRSQDHLRICPPEIFEDFLNDLRANTADKSLLPDIERELNNHVCQASLDRFGRLPLPREFTGKAGIHKRGELVGRFSKFEVWPSEGESQRLVTRPEAKTIALDKLERL